MEIKTFYVGNTVRGRFRAWEIDPETGERTPDPNLTSATVRFKRPDGTILATRTIGAGVTNVGNGWYYGTATPDVDGLHELEVEIGQAGDQGRGQLQFNVMAF